MSEIDDMWHTFILFTKDNADFCQHYFGLFFHHQPTADDEKIDSKEQYWTLAFFGNDLKNVVFANEVKQSRSIFNSNPLLELLR